MELPVVGVVRWREQRSGEVEFGASGGLKEEEGFAGARTNSLVLVTCKICYRLVFVVVLITKSFGLTRILLP